jgi:hypothetical protein
MLQHLSAGTEACIGVTILDALVLARSAFHHSMNYRSVVLFGQGKEVLDAEEKVQALKIISDQIIPGRWEEARKPDKNELKATTVIKFEIKAGSAKVRTGPPKDNTEDYTLDIWAGLLPFKTQVKAALPDPDRISDPEIPISVIKLRSKHNEHGNPEE